MMMVSKLCGKPMLQNVVIMTTMWDDVSRGAGEARESELVTNYLKPALDGGAQLVRYDNDVQSSAHDIIRRVTRNPELNEPTRQRHQNELQYVRREVIKVLIDQEEVLRRRFEQEIHKVREQTRAESERAIHEVQEQARAESEQEIRKVREYTRNRGGSLFPP